MAEKKVRVKILSRITDLTARNMAQKILGVEKDYDESDDDVIEYSTDGIIKENEKNIELRYEECADMGMENTVTTLIFPKDSPNEMHMVRTGENSAGLIFSDKVKRQPCSYNIGGMPFDFCIYTRSIDNGITLDGGVMKLDYVIEMRGVKTQRTRFTVKVDELRS